jgi:hypothetical protein
MRLCEGGLEWSGGRNETMKWEGSPMMEKILALLGQITDETELENIFWYIERTIAGLARDR